MIRTLPLLRLACCLALAAVAGPAAEPTAGPHPLAWDAMEKTIVVKAGDAVDFEFAVKNQSAQTVTITELRPSCGCTTAEMPATPWVLAPGASGSFRATVDVRGKHGRFSKVIHVSSSAGIQMLGLVVDLPDDPGENRRQGNQAAALANRQAVFKDDCAACHVAPTVGKTGGDLFYAACGICHAASPRAAMVPDLMVAREPRDAAYWRKWITEGREGSLMPAFAQSHGGPLTEAQVTSLVEYALARLPTQPAKP